LRLIGALPSGTPVAFEAAFGWSWLADLLEGRGFESHLVHPLRCKAIASARLKNDKARAAILARLLRAGLLPEAWIAPADVRQLRALLRHRIRLDLPPASREIITGCLPVIGGPAPLTGRIDGELHSPRHGRPAGQSAQDPARRRGVHRAGDARRDRRHYPVRKRP
jgi:transposase